jgi:hypothetical protein
MFKTSGPEGTNDCRGRMQNGWGQCTGRYGNLGILKNVVTYPTARRATMIWDCPVVMKKLKSISNSPRDNNSGFWVILDPYQSYFKVVSASSLSVALAPLLNFGHLNDALYRNAQSSCSSICTQVSSVHKRVWSVVVLQIHTGSSSLNIRQFQAKRLDVKCILLDNCYNVRRRLIPFIYMKFLIYSTVYNWCLFSTRITLILFSL